VVVVVVVVVFLTDNNTTPTKVVLSCFGLLVGLWQLGTHFYQFLRIFRNKNLLYNQIGKLRNNCRHIIAKRPSCISVLIM
jgi:hypothetical protein